MFTSSLTHQSRRIARLCTFLLVTSLTIPAALYAGIVIVPILGFNAENVHGDQLRGRVEGRGPDLTGMSGSVRFRDGASGQQITIVIPDSIHAVGSSILLLLDEQGTPVVEIDLTGVTLTYLPTGTTFMSGLDAIDFRLTGESQIVPD